jgi:hypothetical protein
MKAFIRAIFALSLFILPVAAQQADLFVPALPQYAWTGRPSATGMTGRPIEITDIGIGGSIWISDGTNWKPAAPIVIQRGNVQIANSNDATAHLFVGVLVPGGTLGLNGSLFVDTYWTFTGSTNSKTPQIRLHTASAATGGTAYITPAITTGTVVADRLQTTIKNRNSASSQVGPAAALFGGTGTTTSAVPVTSSIDTSSDTYVNIVGTMASGAETMNLEFYEVRLVP